MRSVRHGDAMNLFRWLWLLHRWLGVALGLVLAMSAVTGLLLLWKKDYAWLQPPVMVGVPGAPGELKPLAAVYEAVLALGAEGFARPEDIARIEFRPSQGVHKVLSKQRELEVQVCATTLQTHGPNRRMSDWLEQLHDGSWFGSAAHRVLMPLAAVVLLWLALSGYVMWLWPKWRRRQQRRAARGSSRAPSV